MIKYLHRPKSGTTTKTLEKYKKGAWVYVENPDHHDITFLEQEFSVDPSLVEDATDEDEMPRLQREGDYTYVFTRYPYTNDSLNIATAPVLFVVGKDVLITISTRPLARLDYFLEDKHDYNTEASTRLLLQLLDQIDDEYEVKLNGISRQIKTIRSRLRIEDINNKDFIDFVLVEDVLNEFLSALVPTNSILKRLLIGKHLTLHDEHEDIVEDLMLNNVQSIEACKSTLKTIVNIREAYSTIMTNNLNRVIRLLTVLTVIISFPTLIASVYGMNVQLPFEDSAFAFAGVMFVSLLVSILLLVIFKKRHWL